MAFIRKQSALILVTDPLHIGSGGYRLGRVDNSIVREPGTNLPKIPGTSLSGAARSFAAMRYESISCAGQGSKDILHCGDPACPICYTFGSLKGETAFKGTVNLYDAQLLFFPVASGEGTVWVTTIANLQDAGFKVKNLTPLEKNQAWITLKHKDPLNFGWLLLNIKEIDAENLGYPHQEKIPQEWDWLKECIAIVKESLFAHIVNSNLEVRTSVSIDPDTGAAKPGALFTYEALPRGTILWFEVVEDDYRDPNKGKPNWPITESKKSHTLIGPWHTPLDVVNGGLELAQWLGVGGMSTRGFGRFKILSSITQDWNPTEEGA